MAAAKPKVAADATDAPKKDAVKSRKPVREPVRLASVAKKEPRKFIDYTLFAKSGRTERPVGTVADFDAVEALKSVHVAECQRSGAAPPVFRIVERDYDESRSESEQLKESEVQ
jgi:hypothetical protein